MTAAKTKQARYKRGHRAESIAVWILRMKGYRVLERRFKTPVGEIDVIARKGAAIVFVEVKSRADIESGLYAITDRAKKRICRAADYFRATSADQITPQKQDSQRYRFDVMIVALPRYRHIPNAWDYFV